MHIRKTPLRLGEILELESSVLILEIFSQVFIFQSSFEASNKLNDLIITCFSSLLLRLCFDGLPSLILLFDLCVAFEELEPLRSCFDEELLLEAVPLLNAVLIENLIREEIVCAFVVIQREMLLGKQAERLV